MKKLLLSSIVLLIFAASMALFQISCKKLAVAQTTTNNSQIGKIIYGKVVAISSGASFYQIWSANYDGTSQKQINISLPANYYINEAPRISPDGKTIFFSTEYYANNSSTIDYRIYSSNMDGSGVKQLVDDGNYLVVGNAY